MAGGHHGSLAGRFFQVAGLGRSAGASAGVLLGAVEVAGSGVDTLAAKRAPSPSEGEGWGVGEGVGVLALVDATEPSGFSPSPRPSPAGRGGDAGSVCAGAAFTFSGGAQTTALAATVTAMVGGWSFMSSRGIWTGAAGAATGGGSLAGRSGAAEAAVDDFPAVSDAFPEAAGTLATSADGKSVVAEVELANAEGLSAAAVGWLATPGALGAVSLPSDGLSPRKFRMMSNIGRRREPSVGSSLTSAPTAHT